ncbi:MULTISPECIES: hypothetical protein [unclassified Acinetobacter]|uniref:hypothetical protein n=1 Tax=unclassified Acinetobacter TaxID=196816 RepID=UPI001C251131|nr:MULTISPECIES: hypothetical protein [unclassified Acinetobacter]
MLKLLLLLCVLFILNAAWSVGRKMYKAQRHLARQRSEKPAQISSITEHTVTEQEQQVHQVDAYELELFDDVAQLFFQRQVHIENRTQAEQLQQEVLQKMPMHSGTQIRQMDLGEWSIFWNFYDQSLEYYVGRYGIFYAHVDRFEEEHRQEIRTDLLHSDCA